MIDEPEETDDEEIVLDEEELADDIEPTEADLADATTLAPEPGLGEVESIQELIAKQETQEDEVVEEEDEAAALAALTRDERLEPIETRVIPIQETEFTCRRCFLVKHRSQLADRKKMLCRDCA